MTAPNHPTSVTLAHEAPFRLGALLVRPATREAVGEGWREILEPRVMQVLVALARADGEVICRDDLTAMCWEGRVVGDDALNRVIPKLRTLAARAGGRAFVLETIRKVGYRLEAVAEVSAAVAPAREPPSALIWLAAVPAGAALTAWVALSGAHGAYGEAPAAGQGSQFAMAAGTVPPIY